MEKYIQQLVADLASAHHAPEEVMITQARQSFRESMEEIERWATKHDLQPTFMHLCNLTPEQLPPAEKLTPEEMEIIIKAIGRLFDTWNHEIDWPENVPVAIRYALAISLLDEEAYYISHGAIHHDFCDGNAPECVLQEYCPCKARWEGYGT